MMTLNNDLLVGDAVSSVQLFLYGADQTHSYVFAVHTHMYVYIYVYFCILYIYIHTHTYVSMYTSVYIGTGLYNICTIVHILFFIF
jgi:hypothetical protein